MRRLLVLLTLLPSLALGTPALVQKANNHASSSTTCAVSLTGVTANDTLIVYAYVSSEVTPLTSILDSSGDTVSTAKGWVGNSSPGASFGLYYVQAATAGSHTLTFTVGSSVNLICFLSEWSGLATSGVLDKAGTINFSTSATVTSGSGNAITPTVNGDLIIFAFGQNTSGLTYSSYNNSFVQQDTVTSGPSGAWASEVQATAASIYGQATASASEIFGADVAAFIASGACTYSGLTSGGAISVPNGTSGSYRLENGSFGTPNCSTTEYFQPTVGNFGVD